MTMKNTMMHHFRFTFRTAAKLLTPGLCLALMIAAVVPEPSQDLDKEKVARVKAAYLLNFTKYVTWPEDAFENEDSPIVIGVCDKDPVCSFLESIDGKRVRGRSLEIRRLRSDENGKLPESKICELHLIYVSDTMKKDVSEILDIAHEADVLTVSDIEEFASDGGMIGLVLVNNRIIFEINHEVVKKTHLKMSSKLLKLARIVKSPSKKDPSQQSTRGKESTGWGFRPTVTLDKGRLLP